MKTYKIIMLTGSDFNKSDGPVLHFYSIFKELKKIDPDIIACAPVRGRPCSEFSDVRLFRSLPLPVLSSLVYQLKLFLFLIYSTLSKKPDLIYVRSHYCMIAPFLINKIFNIPMITEFNGIIDDQRGRRNSLIVFSGKITEKLLAGNSKAVITVTQGIKNWISSNYGINSEKIFVIPNGADLSRFSKYGKSEIRKQLNFPDDLKILTYVGTLTWWQGLEYMIEALHLIDLKIPLKLVIVGEGPEMEKLKKLSLSYGMDSQIIFTGRVSSDVAAQYVVASDICVVPKKPSEKAENIWSPLKMYEYMAAGKPIIASDCEDFEIIEKIGCGETFKANNAQSLAAKINKFILMDDNSLCRIGDKGREYVRSNASWEHAADNTFQIIKNVISA